MSNDSSPTHGGYPDFPPSPDSWLGGDSSAPTNLTNSTPAVHYWYLRETNQILSKDILYAATTRA